MNTLRGVVLLLCYIRIVSVILVDMLQLVRKEYICNVDLFSILYYSIYIYIYIYINNIFYKKVLNSLNTYKKNTFRALICKCILNNKLRK